MIRSLLGALLVVGCHGTGRDASVPAGFLDAPRDSLIRTLGAADVISLVANDRDVLAVIFREAPNDFDVRTYRREGARWEAFGTETHLAGYDQPSLDETGSYIRVREQRLGVYFRLEVTNSDVELVPDDPRIGPRQRVR